MLEISNDDNVYDAEREGYERRDRVARTKGSSIVDIHFQDRLSSREFVANIRLTDCMTKKCYFLDGLETDAVVSPFACSRT